MIRPRSAFRAPEGSILVSADFCHLELRILAHLSQDTILLSMLQSNSEDAFKMVCPHLIFLSILFSFSWLRIGWSVVTPVRSLLKNANKQSNSVMRSSMEWVRPVSLQRITSRFKRPRNLLTHLWLLFLAWLILYDKQSSQLTSRAPFEQWAVECVYWMTWTHLQGLIRALRSVPHLGRLRNYLFPILHSLSVSRR